MKLNLYKIKAKIWVYPGMAHSAGSGPGGGWHFVSVPKKQSKIIKQLFGELAGGWGSLPVKVTIRDISWKTSIFPDKKSGTYLLPLKAQVRKIAGIKNGQILPLTLEIMV